MKAEHQHPSGFLQPLPIPEWKWEVISVNFIIDLHYLMTWIASSRGILVKRETMSKLTILSFGSTLSSWINFTKSLESLIKESELPTRGPRILATYLASS